MNPEDWQHPIFHTFDVDQWWSIATKLRESYKPVEESQSFRILSFIQQSADDRKGFWLETRRGNGWLDRLEKDGRSLLVQMQNNSNICTYVWIDHLIDVQWKGWRDGFALSNFVDQKKLSECVTEKICGNLQISLKEQSTESANQPQINSIKLPTIASWIDRQRQDLDNLYSTETLDNDRIRVALENLKLLIEIRQSAT